MREFIKGLYRFKIRVLWYFNRGYGEVIGIVNQIKDVAIILAAGNYLFGWHLSLLTSILICFISFLVFTLIGFVLKITGMSDFSTRLDNSVNPEILEILENVKKIDSKL